MDAGIIFKSSALMCGEPPWLVEPKFGFGMPLNDSVKATAKIPGRV